MFGHGWVLGPSRALRLDAGYRYIPSQRSNRYETDGWGPMALVSFVGARVSAGLWADHLDLGRTVFEGLCDDACDPSDTMASRFGAGLFVRFGGQPLARETSPRSARAHPLKP